MVDIPNRRAILSLLKIVNQIKAYQKALTQQRLELQQAERQIEELRREVPSDMADLSLESVQAALQQQQFQYDREQSIAQEWSITIQALQTRIRHLNMTLQEMKRFHILVQRAQQLMKAVVDLNSQQNLFAGIPPELTDEDINALFRQHDEIQRQLQQLIVQTSQLLSALPMLIDNRTTNIGAWRQQLEILKPPLINLDDQPEIIVKHLEARLREFFR